MKKMIVFAFSILSVAASPQEEKESPLISKKGEVNGSLVSAKFNKQGGHLISGDKKIELIIPEGAVSKRTEISIQPITNQMTNGNGKAYRLEPSGIHFDIPVKIIFHYNNDSEGDQQLLLGIAMQDANGLWHQVKNYKLDTINKTISADINHFSDWSSFSSIKIDPSYARVKVSNTQTLNVTGVMPDPKDPGGELAPLIRKPKKVNWKVNDVLGGNGLIGTVSGRMEGAYYSAPKNIPDQNPVSVTASLQGLTNTYNGIKFNDLRLVSNLLIYDNAYEITMISNYKGSAGSQLGEVNYKDTGSFVVSLESGQAKIIERLNKNESDEWDYKGRCKIDLLKSATGNIHITGIRSIRVIPAKTPESRPWIEISFVKAPVRLSLLKITCPPVRNEGETVSTTAKGNAMIASMLPAFPLDVKFEAKEGEQTIMQIGHEGADIYVKFTVKQIKD